MSEPQSSTYRSQFRVQTTGATLRELEVCLGLGAHTHYFEPAQTMVAWLIDHLVTAPPIDGGERGLGAEGVARFHAAPAAAWLAALGGFAIAYAVRARLGREKR